MAIAHAILSDDSWLLSRIHTTHFRILTHTVRLNIWRVSILVMAAGKGLWHDGRTVVVGIGCPRRSAVGHSRGSVPLVLRRGDTWGLADWWRLVMDWSVICKLGSRKILIEVGAII